MIWKSKHEIPPVEIAFAKVTGIRHFGLVEPLPVGPCPDLLKSIRIVVDGGDYFELLHKEDAESFLVQWHRYLRTCMRFRPPLTSLEQQVWENYIRERQASVESES